MAQSKRFKKRLFIIVGLLVLAIVVWTVLLSGDPANDKTSKINTAPPASKAQPATQTDTIRLIATGDMLPHDTVNQAAQTNEGYDYGPLFSEVEPYLQDSDLSFCNQEAPSAAKFAVSGYPTFNAPSQFAKDLSSLGCNIINLANNHSNDKGQAGIDATLQLWRDLPTKAIAGISSDAVDREAIATFSMKDVKFAFLSYTKCSNDSPDTQYGLNTLSRSLVTRHIAKAEAAQVDMIIVGVHWCRENSSTQTAAQESWARYLAAKGVDIVIGTGPHWLQPAQRLDKAGGGTTLVWHSLGNFLNTQLEINGLIGGIAIMQIDTKTHEVTEAGFLPTYMHYEWTAAEAARQDLLKRHNLKLYPLDQASKPLARSQNDTTVSAQTERVSQLMNRYTPVTMLTSQTYDGFGR